MSMNRRGFYIDLLKTFNAIDHKSSSEKCSLQAERMSREIGSMLTVQVLNLSLLPLIMKCHRGLLLNLNITLYTILLSILCHFMHLLYPSRLFVILSLPLMLFRYQISL